MLDLLFAVMFVAVMLYYSVPLTLIVLAALPVYVGLSLLVVPVLRGRLDEKFARGAENQAFLVETVTASRRSRPARSSRRWPAAGTSSWPPTCRLASGRALAGFAHEGVDLIGNSSTPRCCGPGRGW